MRHLNIILLIVMTMALAACGGAGTQIASILPPPVPTPTPTPTALNSWASPPLPATPGMTAGTYDTIAQVSHVSGPPLLTSNFRSTATPGEVRIKVEPETKTYTLLINAADVPFPQTVFTVNSSGQIRNADGTTSYTAVGGNREGQIIVDFVALANRIGDAPADVQLHKLYYHLGLSHVSYGLWQSILTSSGSDGTPSIKEAYEVYFVHGDRTAAADIPALGTATYAANKFLGAYDYLFGDTSFILKADFGARSISALIDVPPQITADMNDQPFYGTGLRATGSAPFTAAGDFTIALVGVLTDKNLDPKVVDVVTPITGAIDGAFFGPRASQIGGVYRYTATDGRAGAGTFVGSVK